MSPSSPEERLEFKRSELRRAAGLYADCSDQVRDALLELRGVVLAALDDVPTHTQRIEIDGIKGRKVPRRPTFVRADCVAAVREAIDRRLGASGETTG